MSRRVLDCAEYHFSFPCAAGTEIDTFERSGTLARDVVYRRVSLPAGSTFRFDCDFHDLTVKLVAPTVVHGVAVPVGSTLQFPPVPAPLSSVVSTWFLPLYVFPLVCSLSARWRCEVTLVPSGPLVIGEFMIRAADRLTLDRSRVCSWLLSSPRACRGLELSTGNITFDANGRVSRVLLYRSQTVQGIPCFGAGLGGTELCFDKEERLRRLVLAEAHTIGERTYQRGSRLALAADGGVTACDRIKVEVDLYTTADSG